MIERSCDYCGNLYNVHAYLVRKGIGRFCSRSCASLAQVTQVKLTCIQCGKTFSSRNPNTKTGGGKYCSRKCMGLGRSKKVSYSCARCGKICTVSPSGIKGRGKYCSQKCTGLDRQGSRSARWLGGSLLYGENWHEQRRLAYERDGGVCQLCHRKPRKGERRFAVHHIKKFRSFNGDYKAANVLNNLITLCHNCHPKVEHGKIATPVRLF